MAVIYKDSLVRKTQDKIKDKLKERSLETPTVGTLGVKEVQSYVQARLKGLSRKAAKDRASLSEDDLVLVSQPDLVKEMMTILFQRHGIPTLMAEQLEKGMLATKVTSDGETVPDWNARQRFIAMSMQFLGLDKPLAKEEEADTTPELSERQLKTKMDKMSTSQLLEYIQNINYQEGEVEESK